MPSKCHFVHLFNLSIDSMDSRSFQRPNETESLFISNLPAFENDSFRIDQSVYAELRTLHEETATAVVNLSFNSNINGLQYYYATA